uniref:Uncharacterized protein n=1 Tax=Glycine max TaxID=3847 RepID=A0A0R0I9R0_SOYBN
MKSPERSFDIDGEFPESNIQYSEAITLLNNTTNYMKLKNLRQLSWLSKKRNIHINTTKYMKLKNLRQLSRLSKKNIHIE